MINYFEEKRKNKFIQKICTLEPIQFFGLCRIMNVDTKDKDGQKLLEEVISRYLSFNRIRRRTIDRMLNEL